MTFAERELAPLGFELIEQSNVDLTNRLDRSEIRPGVREKIVFSFAHLKLQFDCVCPAYPHIKALGCPLHHEGPGSSWAVDQAKEIASVLNKTTITFRGYPERPGLYGGYNVLRYNKVIGCIEVSGYFRNTTNTELTSEEKSIIKKMCKRVYEMPSEWGLLGVGESPVIPYERYAHKNTDLD